MSHSCRLALLLAVLGASLVGAADPPAKAEAEAETALRKAAENAEVHGAGVSGPRMTGLHRGGIEDWVKLAAGLRADTRPARRVSEFLPKEARAGLANDELVGRFATNRPGVVDREVGGLQGSIAATLRDLLPRPDFYTPEAFKGVALDKESTDLIALGAKRTYLQNVRLNRALLAAAFPGGIGEVPKDYHTTRVRVLQGREVVLVLSSHVTCRWEVQVEKGAKVAGVILCGYGPQEVGGIGDVPVVYRAYLKPDGTQASIPRLHCHDKTTKSFKVFEKAVKELTGKDFTSFQGYPGVEEPFLIRPVAD